MPHGGAANAGTPLVAGQVRRYETDSLAVSIDAPARGLLVVNEAFYPGWRATVDGEPVPIFRANALVRAVPLAAGVHTVAMAYRPREAVALRWLWLATSLLLVPLFVLGRGRRGSSSRDHVTRNRPRVTTPR